MGIWSKDEEEQPPDDELDDKTPAVPVVVEAKEPVVVSALPPVASDDTLTCRDCGQLEAACNGNHVEVTLTQHYRLNGIDYPAARKVLLPAEAYSTWKYAAGLE